MRIALVSMHKSKEKFVREAERHYAERMKSLCKFEVVEMGGDRFGSLPPGGSS